jgi:hypothetical protein
MIQLWVLLADAMAAPACIPADVCPNNADPCLIEAAYEVGDGCVLDFGRRAVEVRVGGSLDAQRGRFAIRARSFVLGSLSRLTALDGGAVQVQTTGDTRLEGPVDMWSAGAPSALTVDADSVWISGPILAYGASDLAPGGAVTFTGRTQVILEDLLDLRGGLAATGGSLDLFSVGPVSLDVLLDASGGLAGGRVMVDTASNAFVGWGSELDVSGAAPGADGGTIAVTATGRAYLYGWVRANAGEGGGVSGRGGAISVTSRREEVWLGALTSARGGAPDGDGGSVTLRAATDVNLVRPVDVVGAGLLARGGSVVVRAGGLVAPVGALRAFGGLGGGTIDVLAGGTVTVRADLDVGGRGPSADGGVIQVVGRAVDVQSGRVRAEARGAGAGGLVTLEACDLAVRGAAVVYAVGGAGVNTLRARASMVVDGDLLADGENRLVWRGGAPQIGPSSRIDVPPGIVEDPAMAACPAP